MIAKRAILQSVGLHLLIMFVLGVSVEGPLPEIRRSTTKPDIVNAKVIDQAAVAAEVKRLQAAEEAAAKQRQKELDQQQARARELERKRRAEEKRLKELKTEKDRLKKQREEQAKREVEARKKAQVEAEKRKQAEAEKARQEQAEVQRKRLEEAERKRIEQALQDELAAEEAAIQARQQAQQDRREIDRYIVAIASRVRQSFTILPGLDGLTCTLRITLIPGGEVAGVQITKSSGNQTFDRQAENAVRKAAPLPVPTEPRLFQQMRTISFVFDPKF